MRFFAGKQKRRFVVYFVSGLIVFLLVRHKQRHVHLFQHKFGGKQFLTFEPLALVPIQQKLIDRDLMTKDEV